MAEKGLLIKDQAGGDSVAMRDATNPDDLSNPRVIQITDMACRPIVFSNATADANRNLDFTATSDNDPNVINPLPAGMAASIIDTADAASLVVWVVVRCGNAQTEPIDVRVTPIILSDDATPVAVATLPPIRFPALASGDFEAAKDTIEVSNTIVLSGGAIDTATEYISQAKSVQLLGAKKVALHVSCWFGDVYDFTLDVFAGVSSLGLGDALADKDSQDMSYSAFMPLTHVFVP